MSRPDGAEQLRTILDRLAPGQDLARATGGVTPPTVVQAVWGAMHLLPRADSRHPRGRVFREGTRRLLEDAAIPLRPSRRELSEAVDWLARRDMLPIWVEPGAPNADPR